MKKEARQFQAVTSAMKTVKQGTVLECNIGQMVSVDWCLDTKR